MDVDVAASITEDVDQLVVLALTGPEHRGFAHVVSSVNAGPMRDKQVPQLHHI